MFTQEDLAFFASKGISPETVEKQLALLSSGFPYLRLKASAKVGSGIMQLSVEEQQEAVDRWQRFLAQGGEVVKFVPASGAASRMFKALFSFVNGDEALPAPGSDVDKLIANIDKLPFIDELNHALVKLHGKNAQALIAEGRHKDVVSGIIMPDGLNYGALPKALLTFHRYADGSTRTPLEEQLMEGAQTAAAGGRVKLHFTVSDAHRQIFAKKLEQAVPAMEKLTGLKFDVSTSEQKPSTDTIASTLDGQIFRDDKGRPMFRPGGHGALIENLNDIDSTVVFIKNIDNVVPDSQRSATIRSKQVLGGTLMLARDRVNSYLELLDSGEYTADKLQEIAQFLEGTFCITAPQIEKMEGKALADFLRSKLDRPIRVCGMVRNEGEPGGGPYLAYNADGTVSPQILESVHPDT